MTSPRGKSKVIATRNFEQNLEHIERFLEDAGAAFRFEQLVDDLLERVVPALERTPRIGAPIGQASVPAEAAVLFERILLRLKAREARTLVRGDFVLLNIVSDGVVHLVAMKHHREGAFRIT